MKLKADYFTSCNPAVLAKDSEPLCAGHICVSSVTWDLYLLAGGVLLSFILIFELCKATIKIKKKKF